jgi:hypothetical protein
MCHLRAGRLSRCAALLAGLILFVGAGAQIAADTLKVANNGLDSPTCGSQNDPCRSISQTIINAADGDRIIVGPGHYGDLNRDGDFDDPGEEAAEVNLGCDCMIKVDKAVMLVSRDGAAATVLDADQLVYDGVHIEADGVVFGKKGHGFTITRAILGLTNTGGTGIAIGVKVEGNIASDNILDGFAMLGSDHEFKNNAAIRNRQYGINMGGNGNVIRNNVSISNGSLGFNIHGENIEVINNIAIGTDYDGFTIRATWSVIKRNASVGNGGVGMRVFEAAASTITENNFFGNDTGGDNCGMLNNSGSTITAINNYWGASTGPGADPADLACGAAFGDPIIFAPFATKEFKFNSRITYP